MRGYLLQFLLLILSINTAFSQQYFENNYAELNAYSGYKITPTYDKGYVITGFCNPTFSFFGQELLILKIDSVGNHVWSHYFGDISSDFGYSVIESNDHDIIAVGYGSSPTTSSSDGLFVKLDEFGNLEKTWYYGGLEGDGFNDLVQINNDSSFYICGNYGAYGLILKVNKEGDTLWSKKRNYGLRFDALSKSLDESFFYASGENQCQGYVEKIDLNGDSLWSNTYSELYCERLAGGITLSSGNALIVGSSFQNDTQSFPDAFIREVNSNGTDAWQESYGIYESEYLNDIALATDGFVALGTKYIPNGPSYKPLIWLVRFDESGQELWEKSFGNLSEAYGYSICKSHDNGFIICGDRKVGLDTRLTIIKVDENGAFLDLKEIETDVFNFSIYPNPASTIINIDFRELSSEKREFILYNSLGQVVLRQTDDGSNEVVSISNLENLNPGVYQLNIQTATSNKSTPIVII